MAVLVRDSPWAQTIGRPRCLRGVDTLTALGLAVETRLERRHACNRVAAGVAAPPPDPEQESDLRVVVDLTLCQGYAQCCYLAPEAFRLSGRRRSCTTPTPTMGSG